MTERGKADAAAVDAKTVALRGEVAGSLTGMKQDHGLIPQPVDERWPHRQRDSFIDDALDHRDTLWQGQRDSLLRAKAQEVQAAASKVIHHLLQTARTRQFDLETSLSRRRGRRFAYRKHGLVKERGDLGTGVAKGIGASDQQAVDVIGRRGDPADGADFEQRETFDLQPRLATGVQSCGKAGLRPDRNDPAHVSHAR